MRAFVGIDLEPAWRDALGEACAHIRDTDSRWRSDKWVPPENLHVTLKFLGEISPESARLLARDLSELAAASDPFLLDPGEFVHAVPRTKRASMLWCTFQDPEGECGSLAAGIERLAVGCGVAPDERTFAPHVTLVRARTPRPAPELGPANAMASSCLLSAGVRFMSVRDVTFFRSTLTRSGPRYERLTIARLGG